ncbi:MAG: PEP/pyruvate-binding domain-containing protein [Mobilitalea sp.]
MMQTLSELTKDSNTSYGAKAANLGEAIQAGLPVPEGFALSFDYLEEYIKDNQIKYTVEQYMAEGSKLRDNIIKGTFSPKYKEQIVKYLENLKVKSGCGCFVVRSSSLLEDNDNHSMAGMFESFINLSTFEEVMEAIKKCYVALFSDKVLNYMFEHNLSFHKLKMGIVVQEFLVGKPSGVLFTADPISMNEQILQLNAVDSICADFEGSTFPSVLYSIDKESGLVVDTNRQVGAPEVDGDILELVRKMALRIEQIFGKNQDVEWTYVSGKVYVLQVRPITTFSTKEFTVLWDNPEQKENTWFCMMPTPYPPIMQEVVRIEVEQMSEGAYETLFRTDTYGECTIQNGYAFVRSIPIEKEQEKRQAYLKELEELAAQGKCIYHDCILPKLSSLVDQLEPYVGKELSKEEIKEYLRLSLEYLRLSLRQHWPAVQANEFLYRFEAEFLSTYKDMGLQEFYDLVYGFTLLSRDRELIFLMSRVIKKNHILIELFQTSPYDTVIYAQLKNHIEAKELLDLMDIYIAEFGVCDCGEDTIMHPVVMERPDYIVGSIRRVLDLDESVFFDTVHKAKEKKEKVKNSILERLTKEEQSEFQKKLSVAEKAFLTNDNHNYYMERLYRGNLRLATMEVGRLFCRNKILENAEDIMYFYISEILDILGGAEVGANLVASRKAEYREQMRMAVPQFIGRTIDPKELENMIEHRKKPLKPEEDGQADLSLEKVQEKLITLQGVSGLKKSVRGKVYVGMPDLLLEDRILVLPHCHCGDIMPFINKVKGLIFQWGSPYDHPGIIARELNIPAIYKTNDAMNLLKTDDEVELNGYTGVVTILLKNNINGGVH